MNLFRIFLLVVVSVGLNSCRECSISNDPGNPDRYIRVFDQQNNNLLFGATAIYDPYEVQFIHEREGVLPVTVQEATMSLVIQFPVTKNQAEEIVMQLDSANSEVLTYNTLVFTNNDCTQEYNLSYVQINGERVCGSCGNTEFNDDRYINIKL